MHVIGRLKGRYGKLALGLVILAGVGVLVFSVSSLATSLGGPSQPFVYYTVASNDLPIVVTERGNLESQQETTIRCEVESRGYDRSSGTQIIFIVPNGSSVEEGEKLIGLDSAQIREDLSDQEISYEQSVAAKIQAQAKYDNQVTQNETAKENAALDVKLAKLELEMFTDEESGTHKLEVEEINRTIEDTNNEILAAQASLELKRNDKLGIEALFKLGYAGKSEVDRSRLEFLQAESQYASKMNRLETELATLKKKETYERKMEMLRLEGALATAERHEKQVEVDNASAMAQAKAALEAATKSLEKEEERLGKLKEQLAKCTITAPHDGMVVYQSEWGRDPIAEGTFVRERQEIIALPNLSKMQVKTYVHESVLDQVQPGQQATVRVDAFPDRTYRGVVDSVGVVPADRGRYNRDVKTYETVVKIEGAVNQLKPGMTAVVEIHVDRIKDVLTVPVQAIVQIQRDTWCYVDDGGGVEQRMVSLGRTNDKFVHVREGLAEGERVILNPMLILEQQEGDTGAGAGEDKPEYLTDEPEKVASRDQEPRPPQAAQGRGRAGQGDSREAAGRGKPPASGAAARGRPGGFEGQGRRGRGRSGGPPAGRGSAPG